MNLSNQTSKYIGIGLISLSIGILILCIALIWAALWLKEIPPHFEESKIQSINNENIDWVIDVYQGSSGATTTVTHRIVLTRPDFLGSESTDIYILRDTAEVTVRWTPQGSVHIVTECDRPTFERSLNIGRQLHSWRNVKIEYEVIVRD